MTDTTELPSVALIGATGFAGAAVLDEFLRRGIPVRAIARRPLTFGDGVVPVRADVHDTAALTAAFAGVDTVVSAFNPGWSSPSLYDDYLAGSRSIQRAAIDAGVRRLVVVGGSASLSDGRGGRLLDHLDVPAPYDAGVRATAAYFDELRDETGLDWAYLSPAPEWGPVGPTERRGLYRVGGDEPVVGDDGHATISNADLAVAVVDEAERPRFHRARFTVGW